MSLPRISVALPVLVEGKYDKIRLESVIDAHILTTDGFGIFREREKIELLRRLAAEGLIVLTDSDGAGLLIRSYLRRVLPSEKVYHLYIPQIPGRERRKTTASKEGLLGVEGMEGETLRELFAPFASAASVPAQPPLTKAEWYVAGLSGGNGSAQKRQRLAASLGLPANLSSTALLEAMNLLGQQSRCRAWIQKEEGRELESPELFPE